MPNRCLLFISSSGRHWSPWFISSLPPLSTCLSNPLHFLIFVYPDPTVGANKWSPTHDLHFGLLMPVHVLFFARIQSRHYYTLLFKAFFNFFFVLEAFSDAPEIFNLKLFCDPRTPFHTLKIVLRVCVLVKAFAFVSLSSTKLIILWTQILCLTHLCVHKCWNKVLDIGQVHNTFSWMIF